jgi:hypothetical protein
MERAAKEAFRNTMEHFDELNIMVHGKKYVYHQNSAIVKSVKCGFDGFNINKLLKLLKNTEPIQLFIVDGRFFVFKLGHGYIDGTGATMLIDTFLCYLCGKKVPVKTNSYIGDLEYIKGLKTCKDNRGVSFKNHLAIKSDSKTNKVYFKRIEIEKNVPFLMGKIMAMMSKYFSNDELTYMIPTNIRNYRPDIVSVSNLTEILYVNCKKDDNWLAISKKIHNGIANNENLNLKNIDYGLIMDAPSNVYRGLTRIAARIGYKNQRFLTAGSYTSITHHFEKYCSDKLTVTSAFMIPFFQPLLPYVVAIFEAKGKTNVVFGSNERYINSKTADKILKEVRNIK